MLGDQHSFTSCWVTDWRQTTKPTRRRRPSSLASSLRWWQISGHTLHDIFASFLFLFCPLDVLKQNLRLKYRYTIGIFLHLSFYKDLLLVLAVSIVSQRFGFGCIFPFLHGDLVAPIFSQEFGCTHPIQQYLRRNFCYKALVSFTESLVSFWLHPFKPTISPQRLMHFQYVAWVPFNESYRSFERAPGLHACKLGIVQ